MKNLFIITLAFTSFLSTGQNKKLKDANSIREMCGCFEVKFQFTETFNYSNDSLYRPSDTYRTGALELAHLVKDKDGMIMIQHILVAGPPESPYIIKHWRQDWIYENTNLYTYDHDNKWSFKNLNNEEVQGQWTQKVYQVDDSPRYEGTGSWVHVDGKSYWENTTDAPLPRREYSTRSDYNVTIRGNRHEITSTGWLHDQDNSKVIRTEGEKDVIIADEKGVNVYSKVEDEKCKAAADWWDKNKQKWAIVRAKWDEIYGRKIDLSLHDKVDNKRLFSYLFSDEVQQEKQINKIIESFVKSESDD